MNESPDENAARIAGLLNALADLSGEAEALEACRREADSFDPVISTARIADELLELEADPGAGAEIRAFLERLRAQFPAGRRP
jgi:hypothetical protein